MARVAAVCVSGRKGVAKTPVEAIELLPDHGVRGDAHAEGGDRQVSLLADESAEIIRGKGVPVGPGAFGENILTRGIVVKDLPVGARLRIGEESLLEVTQIGKVCHAPCVIQATAGECIMPSDGIFARVLRGGRVRPGDAIAVLGSARPPGGIAARSGEPDRLPAPANRAEITDPGSQMLRPTAVHDRSAGGPTEFRIAVIVISDSRSAGQRADAVLPACAESLRGRPFAVVETAIIPDDQAGIIETLRRLVGRGDIDLVLTSGGTGLAPRDHTPEATRAVVEREAPGIAELLRLRGLEHTPRAVLTRGIAGAAGRTLIINLPGSPRGVQEGIETLLPILPHALETLRGQTGECARG